jgi:hypothetical protein
MRWTRLSALGLGFAWALIAVACGGSPVLSGLPRPNPAVVAGVAAAAATAMTVADPNFAARRTEQGKRAADEGDDHPRETVPLEVLDRADAASRAAPPR